MMQQIKTIDRINTSHKREKYMDVLWGAWVTEFKYNSEVYTGIDIIGAYDVIVKEKKNDFPFSIDLKAVIALQASVSEYKHAFNLALEIIDLDSSILFEDKEYLEVPEGDSPMRWYEYFEFNNVLIRKEGYYELSILVNQEQKQRIPLWVTVSKLSIIDEKNDVDIEMYPEDYQRLKDEGYKL
jgi:hypothetical protein